MCCLKTGVKTERMYYLCCVGTRKWEQEEGKIKFWGNFAFDFSNIYRRLNSRNKRKKRAVGILRLSNYRMHIIYQHGETGNECIRRLYVVRIAFVCVMKCQPCQIAQEWMCWASSHISLIQQAQKIDFINVILVTEHRLWRHRNPYLFFPDTYCWSIQLPWEWLNEKTDKKRNVAFHCLPPFLIESWKVNVDNT